MFSGLSSCWFQWMACSVRGTQVAWSHHFSPLVLWCFHSTDSCFVVSLWFVVCFVCLRRGWFCLPLLRQWNCIIQLLHYEHRKPSTVLASPAVIRIASKHLHNERPSESYRGVGAKKKASVLRRKNLLLMRQIADEINWPDTELFDEMVQGFKLTGNFGACGVFKPQVNIPALSVEQLNKNTKHLTTVLALGGTSAIS